MRQSLLLFCIFLFVNLYSQTIIYVSPKGNDRGKGTIKSPFRSLSKAQGCIQRSQDKEIVVYMREGRYYLENPLKWDENTVRENQKITIKSYGDEEVTVSGAKMLTLQWKLYKNGIYQAKVTDSISVFDQLVVDGKMQRLARYPNYNPQAIRFGGTSSDAIAPERVKRWSNPVGGFLHAMHQSDWGDFHYMITSKDAEGKLQLHGGWQNNRPYGYHKEHRMVENIFEELDEPGEWFYDKQKKTVFFFPPEDCQINSAIVEVPQLKHLVEIQGSLQNPIRNIVFDHITFSHTTRTFMQPYEKLLRSDWSVYRGGAFKIEGAENCRIENCNFFDLGGNAVFFSNYNRYCVIRSCHFNKIGASAILFVGDSNAVRSPLFSYDDNPIPFTEIDRTPGAKTPNYPSECTVTDNLIHEIGTVEKQITGVQLSMCKSITVSHNTIYNVPRAGINIGDGTWGGHIIEYNDIFDTVKETGDHGSFNSWGRDRYWFKNRTQMDNYAQEEPSLIYADAIETVIIRNNRFRCDRGWDIDLDDGSTNYHIYNNLCLNGGIKLREGFNRVVENNILVNCTFHPHVWFRNSNDVFARNIVMRPYRPIQIKDWGNSIDFNIFTDSTSYRYAKQGGTDLHSIVSDIHFKDPKNGDYSVSASTLPNLKGFQNFPMDRFGVIAPRLKSQADVPQFPNLVSLVSNEKSDVTSWFGLHVKSLTTLGERSATGMDSERGVYVMEIAYNSPFRDYLKANDVILFVDDKPVNNLSDFFRVINTIKPIRDVKISFFRLQQLQTFVLSAHILKQINN